MNITPINYNNNKTSFGATMPDGISKLVDSAQKLLPSGQTKKMIDAYEALKPEIRAVQFLGDEPVITLSGIKEEKGFFSKSHYVNLKVKLPDQPGSESADIYIDSFFRPLKKFINGEKIIKRIVSYMQETTDGIVDNIDYLRHRATKAATHVNNAE